MGEDILMLNNGCLCCTVRSDLVDMLTKLAREKKGVFDHVLIETTGLANPAPIIQVRSYTKILKYCLKILKAIYCRTVYYLHRWFRQTTAVLSYHTKTRKSEDTICYWDILTLT
jgi:hypothetical protein